MVTSKEQSSVTHTSMITLERLNGLASLYVYALLTLSLGARQYIEHRHALTGAQSNQKVVTHHAPKMFHLPMFTPYLVLIATVCPPVIMIHRDIGAGRVYHLGEGVSHPRFSTHAPELIPPPGKLRLGFLWWCCVCLSNWAGNVHTMLSLSALGNHSPRAS